LTILAPLRFVTGGCDNLIKVWTIKQSNRNEELYNDLNLRDGFEIEILNMHTNWVRDVSWLNYVGNSYDTIASGGEDEKVFIWQKKNDQWENFLLHDFKLPVWNVSWSNCGSHLAVSASNLNIYLFKENISNKWELISVMDDQGVMNAELTENN